MDNEWVAKKAIYLQSLKSQSASQKELLDLIQRRDSLNPQEERVFRSLITAERASDRAQKARAQATKLLQSKTEAERKARTRSLIQVGGLVEIAGLADVDKGALLGSLMFVAEHLQHPDKHQAWKAKGDAVLQEREAARKDGGAQS
jgi:hypothetical protein